MQDVRGRNEVRDRGRGRSRGDKGGGKRRREGIGDE